MSHIYKRLSKEQIFAVLDKYLEGSSSSKETRVKLGIKKTQFFSLLLKYRKDGKNADIRPKREYTGRRIDLESEEKILEELKKEKELILNKNITIKNYNYSAVRDVLKDKYSVSVSVPTIISRAKQNGFYIEKKERKIHDRLVLTDFIGEMIQHDSSHHLWSPYMKEKLYLVTSLDDFSRRLLFADFYEHESSWVHIEALQRVFTQFGCPLKYYADQHSIFRYVKNRDEERTWNNFSKFTDDISPQWKKVLEACSVDLTYALSPQAKGKIERPYRWLQDRIVRTAAKEKLTKLDELKEVLRNLVGKYNNVWVHSTTGEVPVERFENALNADCLLFKPLQTILPNTDLKDIFCFRFRRKVDGYRRISFDSHTFDLPKAKPLVEADIHISPDFNTGTAIFRFWQDGVFLDERRVKISELRMVHF
jgi:flagellin-specific chaperone FliS